MVLDTRALEQSAVTQQVRGLLKFNLLNLVQPALGLQLEISSELKSGAKHLRSLIETNAFCTLSLTNKQIN